MVELAVEPLRQEEDRVLMQLLVKGDQLHLPFLQDVGALPDLVAADGLGAAHLVLRQTVVDPLVEEARQDFIEPEVEDDPGARGLSEIHLDLDIIWVRSPVGGPSLLVLFLVGNFLELILLGFVH